MEGGAIQKPIEPGESRSRRDRELPKDTFAPSPILDRVDDRPGRPNPRGPIATAAAPPLRALVRGGGLHMSSTCFPTLFWPCQVSCQLCGRVLVLGCLDCCSLEIATQILFRCIQAQSQRFRLLFGDERFTNAPILCFFELLFGF